jgi:hypothetical protein
MKTIPMMSAFKAYERNDSPGLNSLSVCYPNPENDYEVLQK